MNTDSPARRVMSRVLVALLVVFAITVSACTAPDRPGPTSASATQRISLVDDAGRTVELDGPVQRAVVANRYNSELIRAMGKIDRVVSVDLNTAQDRAYWPMFDPANVIGKGQDDLNLEKITSLHPDVLIVPRNSKADEYAQKLAPSGIKVLVVTGWDNAKLPGQMEILGKAFGDRSAAQRVTDFFQRTIASVTERVGSQNPKKTVYWEYGDPNTTAIPGTSNDGWHNMIVSAGGVNIFGDPTLKGATVDPEKILQANPDLIVKTTSGGALKNTGRYTPPEDGEFARIGAEMVGRTGWPQLKAVRAGDVYLITGFAGGGLGKAVGTVYLAKWLYPEQMKDIDPDRVFTEWLTTQGMPFVAGHTFRVPAAG